jgi:very-short-patch-repair endonuclease
MNNIHNSRYTYNKDTYVDTKSKIEIFCQIHGSFWQRVTRHLSGDGCPVCSESKGEKIIREYLQKIGYEFQMQVKFPTCILKKHLKFDFHIPSLNLLIEFNGIQHYPDELDDHSREFFKDAPEKTVARDIYKTKWCEENMINLLRIRYDEDPVKKLEEYIAFLKEKVVE